MIDYPEVVAKIANDYLERVKSQLKLVPAREQDEFLREIQSHLYEAYLRTPGDDDVARILAVLRNFGEPAEIVADRLPGAMLRSGAKRSLPLYILGGILIALFGISLGFGGVAVLAGILVTLAAIVFTYYVIAGSIVFAGAVFMLAGLTRILLPQWFDKLVTLGYIQLPLLDQLSPSMQGFFLLAFATLFGAGGLAMIRRGTYLIRGLRFLFNLALDWVRRGAQRVRRSLRRETHEGPLVGAAAPTTGSVPGGSRA